MGAKLNIKDMHDLAEARNGKFLSLVYLGADQKHDWQCNVCNHIWPARPKNIKKANGTWCPRCADHALMTIDDMHILAAKFNGKFLSEKYFGSNEIYEWQCEFGHTWLTSSNQIKNRNTWCPHCAGNAKGTIEEMRAIATIRGGKCLSTKYDGCKNYLEWQCGKCQYIWPATPDAIKNGNYGKGSWCPECGKGSDYKYTIKDMQKIAEERGGKCLSINYIGFNTKLWWQCNLGHEWPAIPHTIKDGTWCPYCICYFNQEICRGYLEQLFLYKFLLVNPNWLKNINTERNLTLDGYCSELNIAFEYNGKQHYKPVSFDSKMSEEQIYNNFQKQKERDKLKQKLCKQNNTKLIIIPYWENKNIPEFILAECKRLNIDLPKEISIDIEKIKKELYIK
jgi:hypothetical protein